jgi:hypothetical protein
MSFTHNGRFRHTNWLLFLLVSTIAFGFLQSPGTVDVGAFMEWTQNAQTHGIVGGYLVNAADYPPLTTVMLWGIAHLSQALYVDNFIAFKLFLFFCLVASALIFYLWTKNLFLASIFQLALLLNTTALGYTDITYTPTLLLALWALQKRRWLPFTLLYGISCLIKWQPIIIAPVLLIYILNISDWRQWRQIDIKQIALQILLPALIVTAILLAVFGTELFLALDRASVDELLSGNALNFNWILTHYLRLYRGWLGGLDNGLATWVVSRDWRIIGVSKLLFFTTLLASCYMAFRRPKTFTNAIFYTFLAFLSYFMFNTGVHENHLYIGTLLAAILYAQDKEQAATFVIWALVANANLYFFYGTIGNNVPFNRVAFVDIALLLSILNLVMYLALFLPVLRHDPYAPATELPPPTPAPAD